MSPGLAGKLGWPGLQQVCQLQRSTTRRGKFTVETVYAITSLSPAQANAATLLPHWVGHWGIENRLHWVRDAVLREDNCRANIGHCPQNLAACRNVAISLLRLARVKGILSTLRTFASRPRQLLQFLGIMKN